MELLQNTGLKKPIVFTKYKLWVEKVYHHSKKVQANGNIINI
jgi:hypothetical protein